MTSRGLRIAGLRLVIEGANAFQDQLDRTEAGLKENKATLQLVDAQYGKYNNSLEKSAAKQKLYQDQLELQKQKLEALKSAYEAYAQKESATEKNKEKLRLAIMKQETAVAGLTRSLGENEKAYKSQQAAEERAAQEQAAYQASVAGMGAQLETVNAAMAKNAVELKKLDAYYGAGSKNPEKLAQAQALLTDQLENQRAKVEALTQARDAYAASGGAYQNKLASMSDEIAKEEIAQAGLERQLRETSDELTKQAKEKEEAEKAAQAHAQALEKEEERVSSLGYKLEKVSGQMRSWGDSTVKTGEKISKAGGKITRVLTSTVGAAFTYVAKEAIDFEAAFAGVVKTVDASDKELSKLRSGIIGLSGSGLVTQSKEDVAEVAAIAGQLAVATPYIMGFSQAMMQMEDATNLTAASAAEQMAQFANITGMSQALYANLGSAIVDLGNNSAAQEDAILGMGMRMAAAGKQAKMTQASIMGISAAMASVGLETEMGGSAISKVLVNMDVASAKGEKAMASYAKVAGMSAKEFKKLWGADSAKAFTAFIEGLGRIDKEGGSVALTLEKMGYKEQRVRDALTRAALAGDLLGNSIERANTAFEDNAALSDEAAKKNATLAAKLSITKNRVDNAAMTIGEKLTPYLSDALDKVSGMAEGFARLDGEQQKNILTMGAVALGVGPAIKGYGLIEQGVGHATKAIAGLSKITTGGWIGIGIAGITALGVALSMLKSPLQKIENQLKNVNFDVDEEIAAKINSGISGGVEAAKKAYTISIEVDAEMKVFEGAVDAALKDNDISKKENKTIQKQLNEMVKKEIDAAQAALQTSVTTYLETLGQLKNASGEPLFTEEEKAQMVENISGKTTALIEELKTYQGEFNALMDALSKPGVSVTAQQMAELETFMAKIAEVKKELRETSDMAIQVAKANYDLTVSGRGDERTTGAALGYVKTEYDNAVKSAEAARDASLAVSNATADATQRLAEQEAALATFNAALAAAAATANEKYEEILGGEAVRLGVDGKLAWLSALGDYVATTEKAIKDLDNAPLYEVRDAISNLFGEGGELERFMPGLSTGRQSMIEAVLGGDWDATEYNIEGAKLALGEVLALLKADALQIANGEDMNPMTSLFQTMFDAGAFDPSSIDLSTADGALEGILNMLNFTEKGEEYGYKLADGIGTGMTSEDAKTKVKGGGETLTGSAETGLDGMGGVGTKGGDNLKDGLVQALLGAGDEVFGAGAYLGGRAAAGINSRKGINAASPSKKSKQSARWLVLGMTNEMDALRGMATRSASALGGATVDSLNDSMAQLMAGTYRPNVAFDIPIAGNQAAMEQALYGSRKAAPAPAVAGAMDNSTNLTIQHATFNNQSDAQGLMLEMDGMKRRRAVGYGARVG